MRKQWMVASTGFALFAMFFGSGNLVFPIEVGKLSDGHFLSASLGIILTGVIVPFLGVLGMMLYQGSLSSFFSCFGKKGTVIFSFLALALMGPFGVLARCLTVAHGAIELMLPDVNLTLTSIFFAAIIYFSAVNKSKILSALGSYLTPVLLLAIALISYFGIKNGNLPEVGQLSVGLAFKEGFFQGYQTMDLLAAFFFSGFVIKHLQKNCQEDHLSHFYKASLVGGALLSFVYFALVVLGSIYKDKLTDVPPQEMLGIIALESLGTLATPFVCLAVVLACLTTAIVLTTLFSDFLRKEVLKDKISYSNSLLVTLAIGVFVSTFDFAGIAKFLGPLLEAIYPALISLTVVNIGLKALGTKSTHWPFTLTLLAKLCFI